MLIDVTSEIRKGTDAICDGFGVEKAQFNLIAGYPNLEKIPMYLPLEGPVGGVLAAIIAGISGMLIGTISGLFIATPDLITQILAFIFSAVVAIFSALGIKMGIREWTEEKIKDLDLGSGFAG